MKRKEPVSKIMTKNVLTVDIDQKLTDVERMFKKKKIRHVPVVDDDKLVGMLSLTDLQRISFVDTFGDEEDQVDTAIYSMLGIEQIMVSKPITVDVNQTIKEVATILSQREFHALPVLDGEKLVGIVTTTDLIKYLIDIC